jgi:phosphate/sulfate permease
MGYTNIIAPVIGFAIAVILFLLVLRYFVGFSKENRDAGEN